MKKAAARPQRHRAGGLGGHVDQARQHEHQQDDRLELPGQIGVGSLADRRADLAHPLGPLVGPDHLADQPAGVKQTRDRDAQHDPKRDFLHEAVSRVGRESEELKFFLGGGATVAAAGAGGDAAAGAVLVPRPSWPPLAPAASRAPPAAPGRGSRTE